jgi:muramoyltetrapeptide carboxypeptidase
MNRTFLTRNILTPLQPGDSVDIIAPASRCTLEQLNALRALLTSWELKCRIAENIFGDDVFCANTDEIRFEHLQNALLNEETRAIFCVRGGYGSMRIVPKLTPTQPTQARKLFVGMSDITVLHLFLQQAWHWPTIHGSPMPDKFSFESITALKSILFGKIEQVQFTGLSALNSRATKQTVIEGQLIGGNLCLIQAGIGTSWQLQGKDKIIFLEEINERGYRIDRMLEHLRQAGTFKQAAAIVCGDFLGGEEPNGTSLIMPALIRFAQTCGMPVVQVKGIGHGYTNFPLPLGTATRLELGNEIKLTCSC